MSVVREKALFVRARDDATARVAGRASRAAMGLSAAAQPHFQAREAEQRAMVAASRKAAAEAAAVTVNNKGGGGKRRRKGNNR